MTCDNLPHYGTIVNSMTLSAECCDIDSSTCDVTCLTSSIASNSTINATMNDCYNLTAISITSKSDISMLMPGVTVVVSSGQNFSSNFSGGELALNSTSMCVTWIQLRFAEIGSSLTLQLSTNTCSKCLIAVWMEMELAVCKMSFHPLLQLLQQQQ